MPRNLSIPMVIALFAYSFELYRSIVCSEMCSITLTYDIIEIFKDFICNCNGYNFAIYEKRNAC